LVYLVMQIDYYRGRSKEFKPKEVCHEKGKRVNRGRGGIYVVFRGSSPVR